MENNYDSFESYFYGRMSAKEAMDFETALNENAELNSAYEDFILIKKAASDIQKDKLRLQLEGIDIEEKNSKTEEQTRNKSTRIYTLMKSAAAIAALFIIGFWGYQASQKNSPEEIFAQNFEAYTPKQSRGEKTEFPSIDSRIEASTPELKLLYATGILSNSSDKDEINESIEVLSEISDETAFRDQKYWYLGLANLKIGNIQEAKTHFDHLQKLSNYKNQEIVKILSAIE